MPGSAEEAAASALVPLFPTDLRLSNREATRSPFGDIPLPRHTTAFERTRLRLVASEPKAEAVVVRAAPTGMLVCHAPPTHLVSGLPDGFVVQESLLLRHLPADGDRQEGDGVACRLNLGPVHSESAEVLAGESLKDRALSRACASRLTCRRRPRRSSRESTPHPRHLPRLEDMVTSTALAAPAVALTAANGGGYRCG